MPLFSEHIANIYYGSTSPYTGSPYSYSSSVSPIGSSYSASYLNPGGSYSNHSSLGGYSRAPLTSRWITSSGRNYAPMLSTISERGSASPVRINSPRRLPLSTRTYHTSNYTPRPVNINTADIDVSRDKYKHKVERPAPSLPLPDPPQETSKNESSTGPFMPRVDVKEKGGGSCPEVKRSTIQRGRPVVRLYTIKRKERDSPRKPTEKQECVNDTSNQETVTNDDPKADETEFMKWREKLSEDLAYKEKKEKKSLGAKLVEKFIVKDETEKYSEDQKKEEETNIEDIKQLPASLVSINNSQGIKCLDRRCSMELMAEQANLFDSLIRSENLSTATLELNKVGIADNKKSLETFESHKISNLHNPLKTTKSDHSLHDSLKSHKDVRDPINFGKRRSIKKSSSGSSLRRLDSITEFPKESNNINLPAIDESILPIKQENLKQKPKSKLKTKITSSVEVSAPKSPLKFIVENVTVEEKLTVPKKEITYSSEVEEVPYAASKLLKTVQNTNKKVTETVEDTEKEMPSPEPENGNFWDKIGKRETVYLLKRKQNIDEAKENRKRALFWYPEDEEFAEQFATSSLNESNCVIDIDVNTENKINNKQLTVHQSKEAEKINTFDKESNKVVISDSQLSKYQKSEKVVDKNTESINNSPEKTTEMNSIAEINKNLPLTKVLDAVDHKDNLTLEKPSEIDNGLSNVICHNHQNNNVGKSASLETVNDTKSKLVEQKKTKSEKTINKSKAEQKLPSPTIQQKVVKMTKRNLLENSNDVIDKTPNNVNNKREMKKKSIKNSSGQEPECPTPLVSQKVVEQSAKSDTIKVPCPSQSLGLQEENRTEVDIDMNKDTESQNYVPDSTLENTVATIANTDDINSHTLIKNKTSLNNNENTKINEKIETEQEILVPTVKCNDSKSIGETSEISKVNKTEKQISPNGMSKKNKISMHEENTVHSQNEDNIKSQDVKLSHVNSNLEIVRNSPEKELSDVALKKQMDININNNVDEKTIDSSLNAKLPSTSSTACLNIPVTTTQKPSDIETSSIDSSLQTEPKPKDAPDIITKSNNIPNQKNDLKAELKVPSKGKTREENKAENISQQNDNLDPKEDSPPVIITPKKPIKEEKALKPLIATPRPLQRKAPQVIHSSDSSDTSSEEDSSEESDDSDSSEGSGEFYECENNPDGRTSTGSNDSGFDSSAPASPATFSQIKKDCDVNCHRKCEKLTANLCGVNQRLLVEALATRTASKKGGEALATSSSSASAHCNNTDILEQQLEQSTAYDIYRKTGRFTPPARSIPRFRKYTVEDFQFIKVLGKGSFGKVLLAELRDTEYYYAVKCLKKDVVLEDDDVECTLIERKVLALGTNHPYLCHLFATFQTDSHLFFVMEYLNGGDLMFHIQQSGRFPEARARFYAAEIVSGLKFLHKRGIVYRDLKLDNILLDYEGHVRIADFGMCKLQIYLDKTADTFCGTPDYMAPEIIKGLKYNQTVDWWSFGVLLYEMLIGQSPFSGCDEDELFWSICNEMPSYPRFLSHEALTILTRLLDKDARTRLGGTECMHGEIRDQEFFHPISWDRLERRELETPFRPRVRHPMDTQYFDRAFTGERPRLTAVEPQVLRSMDQEPFRGFSYTNPNTTDR